jgi:hypothetical protein
VHDLFGQSRIKTFVPIIAARQALEELRGERAA